MKTLINAALTVVFSLPALGFTAGYSEDEVLHATFVAFQQPGILSAEYIAEQRMLLQTAANAGNSDAKLVMERFWNVFNVTPEEAVAALAENPSDH
jgi:hypothetical protein